jgi:glycosyltransferase involved in cell wall biosynthesis
MKIVHVVYSLEMGGAEVLVAQLARIQRANGHDVSLCAYSKLGPIGETLTAEGFSIYVPGEAHPLRTNLRYLQHFRRLRPDVVHCHNPAPTLQAALPARLAGTSCVLSTRHSLVAPPYDRAAELKFSLAARFCNHIVGICQITCDNLRGAPLAAQRKIALVYNGTEPITPPNLSATFRASYAKHRKQHFTLLFVGRLAAIKDLGTLIHAVALAAPAHPKLLLWIVGDGPVRASLEALAAQLNISDRVEFFGQRLDTAHFFAAADAFVMSSVSEGLPMSLLQAMSLGLPAIATDVGGMAEVLRLAGCGLLAPVGDAPAYAAQILRLAAGPDLRAQLSTAALAAYREHFTLAQMDAAYMKLYRSV